MPYEFSHLQVIGLSYKRWNIIAAVLAFAITSAVYIFPVVMNTSSADKIKSSR
jgi:ABC-type multidrug transport system permease subunit